MKTKACFLGILAIILRSSQARKDIFNIFILNGLYSTKASHPRFFLGTFSWDSLTWLAGPTSYHAETTWLSVFGGWQNNWKEDRMDSVGKESEL